MSHRLRNFYRPMNRSIFELPFSTGDIDLQRDRGAGANRVQYRPKEIGLDAPGSSSENPAPESHRSANAGPIETTQDYAQSSSRYEYSSLADMREYEAILEATTFDD